MRNLYSKIYEAINAGIQKALILPDETDSDVSVKFRHKAISNDFIPYELQTVDLGLSVKWCKYNLGAFPGNKPEDWYGNYYAWGETDIKSVYEWSTYNWSNANGKIITKYNDTDNKTVLEPTDDVIIDKCAGKLRIPTKAELEELSELPNEWIENYNDIPSLNGRIFTGHNGNTLFIPAAGILDGVKTYFIKFNGFLWTSSFNLILQTLACNFYFNSNKVEFHNTDRYYGLSVRGVCL